MSVSSRLRILNGLLVSVALVATSWLFLFLLVAAGRHGFPVEGRVLATFLVVLASPGLSIINTSAVIAHLRLARVSAYRRLVGDGGFFALVSRSGRSVPLTLHERVAQLARGASDGDVPAAVRLHARIARWLDLVILLVVLVTPLMCMVMDWPLPRR